ncbi:MAG: hypothetical protein OEL87_01535 [Nanoarchaeota archaeon]|nr:hypothetical protein [Nanoarchaeota archaeon]
MKSIDLGELRKQIGDYLYMEDTDFLDLVLATFLSANQTNCKLWLFIIGMSGGGKSELLNLFDDDRNGTYFLNKITANAIITGYKSKTFDTDLVEQLRNKILLIPEMASILGQTKENRSQILAQLRSLHDGKMGVVSGYGKAKNYTNLNVTLIACSTPIIDRMISLGQELGSRELVYRLAKMDSEKLMQRIKENSNKNKSKIRDELKELVYLFLKERKYTPVHIPEDIAEDIKNFAHLLTYLRASVSIDDRTGELEGEPHLEAPTRVYDQLLTYFRALKSLDDNYSDEKALRLIGKIVMSSIDPVRLKVLRFLMENKLGNVEGFGKGQISNAIRISPKRVFGEACVLSCLDFVRMESEEIKKTEDKYWHKFELNSGNPFVRHLAKYLKIQLEPDYEKI